MSKEYALQKNPDTTHGQMTVLSFLKSRGFSRHILHAMKNVPDALLLNGHSCFGNTLLREGDILTVKIPETESRENIAGTPIPLSILYEDEDILVVNKPADMPVHPSMGNYENTLANAAAFYYAQKGETFVCRCINRLDRDTTGAVLLAKHPLSGSILNAQMRERKIRRTYLALADGIIPESGTIDAPIARCSDSVITREVNFDTGESAVTHYQRLAVGECCSLAELHLDTGRTHQIRVHMKYIGHPLPGDYLYNPDYRRISRQALHSYQLDFAHPITGEPLCLTAPVPEDFIKAF